MKRRVLRRAGYYSEPMKFMRFMGRLLSKMKNGSPGIYREAKTTPTGQKPMKQHRLLRIGIIVTLIILTILTAFTLSVWMFGWDWTGFNGGYSQITTTSTSHGTTTVTAKPPGKTLWDLLQLLIIPVALALIALLFNRATTRTEQKIAAERYKQDKGIASRHYHQDQQIAKQRYEQDQNLALDKQREDLLQTYLDRMSALLLKEKLRSSAIDPELRNVA